MVIFGGLEILAAGYVLNEINKDDKRSTSHSSDPNRRRRKKKHHNHNHTHDHDRPSRPQAQALMPPGAGYRPNSAPPPNWRPPQQTYPRPGQFPPGFAGPGKPNTWPSQARPATPAEQAQWFGRPSVPQQRPPPPALPVAAPVPGKLNPAPTMHFDTKTGKWQSNMLPADMQPNARPRGMSASAGDGVRDLRRDAARNMDPRRTQTPAPMPTASTPSLALVRARRDSSESSGSCSTCSSDEGMAYGKMYAKDGTGLQKIVSHERRRPSQNQSTVPVELDWYATQISPPPLPARTQTPSRIGTSPSPSMAQVLLNRGDRANSLPISGNMRGGGGYSASQPNLSMPVELDGSSLPLRQQQQQMQIQGTASPRMEVLELDGRETGYRAYSGRPS